MKKEITRKAYRSVLEMPVFHRYFTSIMKSDGGVIDLSQYIETGANNAYAALSRAYNAQRFLRIVPDTATQAILDQHHLRFEVTATGFRVVAEVTDIRRADGSIDELVALVPVAVGTSFTFLWYVTDPFFFQYSGLPPAIPAFLKPSAGSPKGMYFKINSSSFYYLDSTRSFNNTPFGQLESIMPVDWTGPEAAPLLSLTIAHRADIPFYQTGTYRPYPQPIRYKTVFSEGMTRWVYKGARSFDGPKSGDAALRYHCGVPLPNGLPYPTLTNTLYVKDNPNDNSPYAPGHYESYIY